MVSLGLPVFSLRERFCYSPFAMGLKCKMAIGQHSAHVHAYAHGPCQLRHNLSEIPGSCFSAWPNGIATLNRWCAQGMTFSTRLTVQLSHRKVRGTECIHSGGVRVRLRVRFQAVKVPIFGGFPVESPTNKATASKLFQGECLCPSTVRRCSEHG